MIDSSGLIGLRNWKCQEDKKRILLKRHIKTDKTYLKPAATKTPEKSSPSCTTTRLLDSQFGAIVLKSPLLRILSNLDYNDK